MLRLERARKGPTITIRLREKDRLFDRHFLRALILATLLHASWLLLFSLTTSPSEENLSVLVPSNVDIDIGSTGADFLPPVLPGTEEGRRGAPRYLVEPEPPAPHLPAAPGSVVVRNLTFDNKWQPKIERFGRLERLAYEPNDVVFPFEAKTPVISVQLSGPIEDLPIVNDGHSIAEHVNVSRGATEQMVLSYHIKVSDDTGKVFWWEETSANADLPIPNKARRLAVTVLETMRFKNHKSRQHRGFVTEGAAEVILEVDMTGNPNSPWQQVTSLLLNDTTPLR